MLRGPSPKLLLLVFLSFVGVAFAMSPDEIYLEGSVKSFNNTEVKIISGNDLWVIPRKLFPQKNLVFEQPVRILLTKKELDSLKHELAQKK